jgi:hypothetical protein
MVKITEVNNPLHINPPRLLCDTLLSDAIPEPLPNKSHFMCIVGGPGQGKTSTMVSLLTSIGANKAYRGVFENVYIFMPPNSRASLGNKLFDKHDPSKIYDELTFETLSDVYSKIKDEASQGYNSLIVLDDVGAALKNKENEKILKSIAWNRRHLRTSIWSIQQTYFSLPLNIRKGSITHLILFACKNKKEYYSVFEELIQQNKEIADAITKYIYTDKHTFMFLDCESGEIYKNFNKLIIE